MDCTDCGTSLPVKARFCPSCGTKVKLLEELVPSSPQGNREMRTKLIDCYANFSMSKELSEWLQDLGLPSTGTTREKLTLLQRHAGSLVLPAESFPRQTLYYLSTYTEDILSEICQELGVDGTGSKDVLLTRIYREVGIREGWLQPLSEDARLIITDTFFPILKSFDPTKGYYLDLWDELSGVLGEDNMHLHVPQAYGSAIIAVLIPAFLQEAHGVILRNALNERAP
jgi:hypothetical protein